MNKVFSKTECQNSLDIKSGLFFYVWFGYQSFKTTICIFMICLFCQIKWEIWKEIVSYNFYWWNQESFAGTAKNSSGQKHYKSWNCLLLLIPLINDVINIVSSSKYTKAFYRWKPWRNYWKYQDTWLVFDPCWHCPLRTNNLWGPMPVKPSKHC